MAIHSYDPGPPCKSYRSNHSSQSKHSIQYSKPGLGSLGIAVSLARLVSLVTLVRLIKLVTLVSLVILGSLICLGLGGLTSKQSTRPSRSTRFCQPILPSQSMGA